ncbi:mucin-2-like [Cyprinodon tularosa]|uniref:mucin-2-like n=1 Tax=Cyprinodon tularosa TaxID=77115 RepID=UPI0018E1EF36|nr:mucin-2-like [Cyprinodon tularosa]
METTVTGNSTDGVNIKCTFTVAKLNASKISSARTTENITYSVVIGSGNVENGKLASFTPGNQSMPIDLATFLSNSPTTSSTTSPTNSPTNSSTTSPTKSPTTSSTTSPTKSPTNSTAAPNGANRPVFSNAVLPLLSFLTLSLLKFA